MLNIALNIKYSYVLHYFPLPCVVTDIFLTYNYFLSVCLLSTIVHMSVKFKNLVHGAQRGAYSIW